LKLDNQLSWQLRLLERCLRRFNSHLTHWLLRLEVIIAHLAPSERSKVAENLQLPDDSIKRLLTLAQSEAEVMESLASLPAAQSGTCSSCCVRLAYADFDCRAKSALYSTPYLVLSDRWANVQQLS